MNARANESTFDSKVTGWIKRLSDLTRRNRLLYFKPSRSSTLEIAYPYSHELFDFLVTQEKPLYFPLNQPVIGSSAPASTKPANNDSRRASDSPNIVDSTTKGSRGPRRIEIIPENREEAPRVVRSLYSKYRSAQEEHGVQVLFLALGMLLWQEQPAPDAETIASPLILVPVTLNRDSVVDPFTMTLAEDEVQVNLALRVKLEQEFGLKLPGLQDDESENIQLKSYWEQVQRAIAPFRNWSVQERAVLSIFKPVQQILINDLEKNRDRMKQNPVIMRLIDRYTLINVGLPEPPAAPELDEKVPPQRVFQVLDADSSQQEVIEAAKNGLSFIVQGPPGTGKSQTIANIIAEFIAAGKKVLFVSEKMAALEVVYKRLKDTGLERYCLVLHSQKTDRRQVVEALGRSLESVEASPSGPSLDWIENGLRELAKQRKKLNAYANALHGIPRTFELHKSAYTVYSELMRLSAAESFDFNISENDMRLTTSEILEGRRESLERLQPYRDVIVSYETHPWHGVRQTERLSQVQRQGIQSALAVLADGEGHFAGEFLQLASVAGAKTPDSVSEARDIFHRFDNNIGSLASAFGILIPKTSEQRRHLMQLSERFRPAVMQLPLATLIDRYNIFTTQSTLVKRFSNEYRRTVSEVGATQIIRESDKSTLEMLKTAKLLQDELIIPDGKNGDINLELELKRAEQYLNELNQAFQTLRALYVPQAMPPVLRLIETSPHQDFVVWAREQSNHMADLQRWIDCQRVLEQARSTGLSSFISQVLKSSIPVSAWPTAYLRRFYEYYLDLLRRSEPALDDFQSEMHRRTVERFKTYDKQSIRLTSRRIGSSRAGSWRPSWSGAASSEEGILRTELNKQRRHKPLRKLLAEIPNLALTLRPCLLMSPLTVSQFLNPDKYQFDLVIFDEASQVPPEHAIGALMRAKQAIIAGDRKQMPPTAFFETVDTDSTEDEDESDSAPVMFDSVLDEADAAAFPGKMLLWHYRSRDESLIAFSNHHFYNDRLITFPSSTARTEQNRKFLDFVYVQDGVYERGKSRTNPREVQKIISLMVDHVRDQPRLSLGVITFSAAQQQAVETLWEKVLLQDEQLRLAAEDRTNEPIFIKNLETVQGDERDIIILSVGHGKDQNGRLILNFGPLNRDGGERRLNVAITRARHQIHLVTSIQPEEINADRLESQGVRLLQSYLRIVRDGIGTLQTDIVGESDDTPTFDSPFEESVYDALTARNLKLRTQVGVSSYRIDLAVVDPAYPGRYLLGIECDGASYHSSATARERDRLRQDILEQLGWRIHRIWSPGWFEDKESEIDKVLQLVDTLTRAPEVPPPETEQPPLKEVSLSIDPPSNMAESATEAMNVSTALKPPPNDKNSADVGKPQPSTLPSWVADYRPTKLPSVSIDLTSPNSTVGTMMMNVVQQEGPVHKEIIYRRIANATGTRRVGNRIESNLDRLLQTLMARGMVELRGPFVSQPGQWTPPVRVSVDEDSRRGIEYIPPEEIELCMLNLVKDAFSLSKDDLVVSTARIFGFGRVGKDVRAAIEQSVESLIRSGRLVQIDDRIQAGKPG